jgi:SAM-dependent methyltransferase
MGRADLRFTDDEYLNHETWIRPAFHHLGELHNRDVLDFGCGHGMAATVLARHGSRVIGFDLSPGYVQEAHLRAISNQVAARFVVANGEALPFADESFDAIWGCAILHHLNLVRASAEIHRVLRPGGVAVFCEPWGGNPLLQFARRWLPYPAKDRTPDEQPLRQSDLQPFRQWFPKLHTEGYQLFGMLRRLHRGFPQCQRLDNALFRLAPSLKNWCRYLVLVLRKE